MTTPGTTTPDTTTTTAAAVAAAASAVLDARSQAVLDRLYREAGTDAEVIEQAYATVAEWDEAPTIAQMSELAARALLPVAPEVGRLLYALVRIARPTTVVEFGSSLGASLVYLAAAVRDNGTGTVVGSELHAGKVATARANLAEAGLAEHVTILEGDARRTLPAVDGPFDLVLLDGWKELYLPVLEALEPRMRPGTVVLADNLSMLPGDYVAHVRRPGGAYASVELPLGDGVELSVRQA